MRASLPGNLTRGVLTLALTTFAGTAAIRPVQAATQLPTGFSEQTVVSGIDRPTSLTVLPDGRVLVTEQHTGRIKLVVGNTLVATPLVIVSQQANSAEERGLLAIAVDPRWPASPYVYVHHTRTTDQQRLLRYTATGDLTTGTSTNLTLGSEYTVMDGITDASTTHNGGTLRFGSDSLLYWSLGDDNVSCLAQDSTSLHGCVMRLEVRNLQAGAGGPPARTLLVPSSNPFAQSANVNVRLVYNYGLRNPFRFQLDPASRLVYVADVGEDTWEELDELGPGANAGWPYREGPALFSPSGCSEPGGAGKNAYAAPIDSYDHNEGIVIIAAGVFRYALRPTNWPPGWDGNVFYADYYAGFMRMLHRGVTGWARATAPGQPDPEYWATGLDYPVDFQWGLDGNLLWVSQYNSTGTGVTGSLRRILATTPLDVGNASPAVRLALSGAPNPTRGTVDLRFELPHAGHATVAVFDLAGRRLASLQDGPMGAGTHHLIWDGRGTGGHLVAAGMYLARLDLDDAAVTTRILRVQ